MIGTTFTGIDRKVMKSAGDRLKEVPCRVKTLALILPSIHRHFFGLLKPTLQAKLHGNKRITALTVLDCSRNELRLPTATRPEVEQVMTALGMPK
ncbi:MAG: hypothetical protein LAO31_16315 [Acidobacteriia bacterium]|nr:hypothetical protein [Terriglobia bacterium]